MASSSASTSASATSSKEEVVPQLSLAEKYSHVVTALEETERTLRRKYHPLLIERAAPIEIDDLQKQHQTQPQDENEKKNDPAARQHETESTTTASISKDGTTASLRKRGLKEVFKLDDRSILPLSLSSPAVFGKLVALDVSHNELTHLPGLSALKNLRVLDLNRNWFNTLPSELSALTHLEKLLAARNFLKPNHQSLQLDTLKASCHNLTLLDLRYNQKCCRPLHRDRLEEALLPLTPVITMTLWEEETNGNKNDNGSSSTSNNYVGSSAAKRDPVLLRSQLEPLGTVALRKRLVCDFGKTPTDPAKVDRSGVMRELLKAYFDEGLAYFPEPNNNNNNNNNNNTNDNELAINCNDGDLTNGGIATSVSDPNNSTCNNNYDSLVANRKTLQLYGSPVPEEKLQKLMTELQKWTAHTGLVNKNRERPSIHASNYMILRKPLPDSEPSNNSSSSSSSSKKTLSRRALRKAQKRERYRTLWEAGIEAVNCIDPVFAEKNCTEIAITHGFSGSPHRDKQNCGPFYGLSLGNYDDSDGKGGIVVEASARVVVRVNTKNKLGRVDGRFVHWVAPWEKNPPSERQEQQQQQQQQRYSLIYYETGHDFVPPGPAVFTIPVNK